ncbi:MAG: phosphotransferase [Erysipelothrix sp.]|nr:phosphotransferase [Erysipelothrix sp.]
MNANKYIEKIFKETPLDVKYIESGLTNDNYIVTLQNMKCVLRIPRIENKGLFDYNHEYKVLKLIEHLNLDTKLLYYNKNTGLKCNNYIENVETYQNSYIVRAAKLIKKLHSANLISGETFDIKDKFNQFKIRITKALYDTEFAHHYIDDLKLENVRLCHNDLVEGNLLFSDTKDYLIDYEYASDNDPFFDIMSFITENDIMDPSLRKLFYDTYFERSLSDLEEKRLEQFEIAHHVLWCEWAMMMYNLHDQEVYKEIAALKYKRLLECTKKGN